MSSKNLKGDVNFSWPSGHIAVMGAEGAVNVIHREELKNSDDPDKRRKELVEDYEGKLMNPYIAANLGMIDDVIDPSSTRLHIIHALEMLDNKRDMLPPKKHGSIPL